MKRSKIILLSCVILLLSCSKDEWISNPEGLEAEISLAAGMCGTTKVIKINKDLTSKSVPQNSCVTLQAEKVQQTDEVVFEKLNSFVKKLDLQKTPIQECWRCVDGADYIVKLRNGSNSIEHSISLNTDDKVRREFIEFLESL